MKPTDCNIKYILIDVLVLGRNLLILSTTFFFIFYKVFQAQIQITDQIWHLELHSLFLYPNRGSYNYSYINGIRTKK